MRLAYIISAYKLLDQLERLVRRISTERSVVLVHVDKKTDNRAYGALVSSLSDLPNVRFLDRHVCHWGGFGHVRATLKGIEELGKSGMAFDYALLLTGQDYPLQPNQSIEQFFDGHRGTSFMAFSPLPSPWWSPRGGLDRIEFRHLRFYGLHLRLPGKRRFPSGLRPYGGGAYWCLSRDCIELVRSTVRARPELVRFFEHVDIPDEIFFQTIVMNSELAPSVVNDHLRYIDWSRGRSPAVLESGDLEALRRSPKLFARKFDVTHDATVLDLVDRELLSPGPDAEGRSEQGPDVG